MSDLATWTLAGVTVVGWSVIFAFLQRGGATGGGKADENRIGDADITVELGTLPVSD